MDEDATIEDIAEATRQRARLRQKVEREVLAGTFTPERYAQLYTELHESIKGLQLPSWWRDMEWKTYMYGSQFFDSLVYDTRASLEKRGITTDDMVEEQVRARVGAMY